MHTCLYILTGGETLSVDKTSSLPLYQQLEDYIREGIAKGTFLPDQRIPSEMELGKEFGVSRMTVRQALNHLVYEGLLYRHPGKGTFVQKAKMDQEVNLTLGFQEKIQRMGMNATTVLLEKRVRLPNAAMMNHLAIDANEPVLYIRRLRLVEKSPVVIQTCVLPLVLFPNIEEQDIEASITRILRDVYGCKLRAYWASMQAVSSNQKESQYLEVPVNSPIMLLEGRTLNEHSRPIRYTKNLYRGDRIRFVVSGSKAPSYSRDEAKNLLLLDISE